MLAARIGSVRTTLEYRLSLYDTCTPALYMRQAFGIAREIKTRFHIALHADRSHGASKSLIQPHRVTPVGEVFRKFWRHNRSRPATSRHLSLKHANLMMGFPDLWDAGSLSGLLAPGYRRSRLRGPRNSHRCPFGVTFGGALKL